MANKKNFIINVKATGTGKSQKKVKGVSGALDGLAKKAGLAAAASQPVGDHRGSEEYKRAVVKTMTARAIQTAKDRAEGGS